MFYEGYSDTIKEANLLAIGNANMLVGKAIGKTISPYRGWYNFVVPELRSSIVERELLSIQEVAEKLALAVDELEKLLQESNCPSYKIKDRELLKRSELNRILSLNPLNGFAKVPK